MITDDDYKSAAGALGVDPAAIKAFAQVESAGSGFNADGSVKILFERHKFYNLLAQAHGLPFAQAISRQQPDICNPTAGGYGKYSEQHAKLDRAVKIDRDCGLQSASWGAFQVMGYQWKICGYASIQAFINDAYSDAGQLRILVGFLKANPGIVKAMNAKDWKTVARLYNGPAYAQNKYDTKLDSAYRNLGGK